MRSGIVDSIVELIKTKVDGSGFSNLYSNVVNKNLSFEEISDFPFCTVTPGVGTRQYLPSNQIWAYLDVYIRLFVNDHDDAQGSLESLIMDIENIIDDNQTLGYTSINNSGQVFEGVTTDSEILSVNTDEGVLHPMAFGEILVRIRYDKHILRR